MRKLLAAMLAILLIAPATAMAAATVEDLQKQIQELTRELEDLSGRIDQNERKSALDRVSFSGDLRVKADTLHFNDVVQSRGAIVDFDRFGADAMSGKFGDPFDPSGTAPIQKLMAQFPELAQAFMMGQLSGVGPFSVGKQVYDFNNDIMYTTRLRLNMKAKVADNVNFAGRLAMYKNWGDATGVQVFDSFNSVTMDGNTIGTPSGDFLRVERAYFDWHDIGGTPFYLSIGRRPSTYGPPSQFRENELRGGTPSGHLVHFQFDGITAGYNLSKHTDVEGQVVRFCYGQGFESDFGNGTLAMPSSDLDDVHLGGFNIDAINDGTHFLQLTLFRAQDVTDGFKGLAAVPVPVPAFGGMEFPVVTRLSPTENLGDITLGGIGYTHEHMNGVNWFLSGAWNRTHPTDKFSQVGFGGLLYDTVMRVESIDENGVPTLVPDRPIDKDNRDGFSVYAGVQVPAPLGKFGLEYNWGSKYWFNFTQAQDDLVGSKLATRGHVGEAYYIFDINPNMFIKVGAIYYDYKYTGSGSPLGMPKKVSDVQAGEAFSPFPVLDEAWDGYASLTVKF